VTPELPRVEPESPKASDDNSVVGKIAPMAIAISERSKPLMVAEFQFKAPAESSGAATAAPPIDWLIGPVPVRKIPCARAVAALLARLIANISRAKRERDCPATSATQCGRVRRMRIPFPSCTANCLCDWVSYRPDRTIEPIRRVAH